MYKNSPLLAQTGQRERGRERENQKNPLCLKS